MSSSASAAASSSAVLDDTNWTPVQRLKDFKFHQTIDVVVSDAEARKAAETFKGSKFVAEANTYMPTINVIGIGGCAGVLHRLYSKKNQKSCYDRLYRPMLGLCD